MPKLNPHDCRRPLLISFGFFSDLTCVLRYDDKARYMENHAAWHTLGVPAYAYVFYASRPAVPMPGFGCELVPDFAMNRTAKHKTRAACTMRGKAYATLCYVCLELCSRWLKALGPPWLFTSEQAS
jgi:hypothetical protein